MDFPIAGPNVNPCNMLYWTYHLTYIYTYTVYIYIYLLYIIWLFTRVWFINQQLGPGILGKLGEVVVLSTLLTVLEQQSTRWSQANKTKDFRFFFWGFRKIFGGFFGFRFVFPSFSSFSQGNSNFQQSYSILYIFSKPSGFGVTVQRKLIHQYKSNSWDGGKSYCWWFRNPARKPPGMYKNPVNNGTNYLSTGAECLPSTVLCKKLIIIHP